MVNGITVRVEHDEDGIWVLREEPMTGDRAYELAQRASELHDEGFLFIRERWVKRPSQGGDINEFLREMGL
jgi:hypothetical protein